MTRQFQIVNASNWKHEPIRIKATGPNIVDHEVVVKAGEASKAIPLTLGAPGVTVTVEAVEGESVPEPVFGKNGEQVFPFVFVGWVKNPEDIDPDDLARQIKWHATSPGGEEA